MREPLDHNKTSLTHVATATVAAWMDGIGCKPVETEVPVEDGWILDLAGIWSPTLTEARQSKLLKALMSHEANFNSFEAMAHMTRAFGGRFTVGVEVKTSRADFMKDMGRKYGSLTKPATLRPVAHLSILACPASVLGSDIVRDWAVLRLSESCERVVKFDGQWHVTPQHPYQIENLMAGVAIRRDHATRYAAMRRWLKSYRAGNRDRFKTLRKVSLHQGGAA